MPQIRHWQANSSLYLNVWVLVCTLATLQWNVRVGHDDRLHVFFCGCLGPVWSLVTSLFSPFIGQLDYTGYGRALVLCEDPRDRIHKMHANRRIRMMVLGGWLLGKRGRHFVMHERGKPCFPVCVCCPYGHGNFHDCCSFWGWVLETDQISPILGSGESCLILFAIIKRQPRVRRRAERVHWLNLLHSPIPMNVVCITRNSRIYAVLKYHSSFTNG